MKKYLPMMALGLGIVSLSLSLALVVGHYRTFSSSLSSCMMIQEEAIRLAIKQIEDKERYISVLCQPCGGGKEGVTHGKNRRAK